MRGSDLQLAWRWMSRGLQVNTELTQNISAQCDEPNVSIQVDTTQNEDRTNIPKFTLLVSSQLFLSKSNQMISTKFINFLQIHFLKCCFFRFSVPWYLESWQKKAISWSWWVFKLNQSCKGSSFKICSSECLYIFPIFSCFSSFLTLSVTHTFTNTYTPTLACWRTSCALSSLTLSFKHKFTHTILYRVNPLYFHYFSLISFF